MKKNLKTIKRSAIGLLLLAFVVGSFGFSQNQKASAATTWNTTGNYVLKAVRFFDCVIK